MGPQNAIAHYRITAKLGEGGMGEVWRATDTKLNREVAVKVLPDSLAADPDRLARFQREAQVLAALNHSNIAAIYGVEERAIVMELVEGEQLTGPLRLDEALPLIRQLIDALEYAHEKGVIHRDLKPANLKVTSDGHLKVLDFGLAKAIASEPAAAADPRSSPTLTMSATMAGMIMGTAAYMAPEQARGHAVDRRADIWAFGVVVYELLTGRMLFVAPTVSDTLAAVLTREPDLSGIPERARRLVQLCLARDPKQRLRDIGDARLLLDEAGPAAAATAKRSWLPWAVAAAALAVGVGAGAAFVGWQRPDPAPPTTVRFPFLYPEGATETVSLAAAQIVPSPDGRRLAFVAAVNGTNSLWIRPMGSPTAHRLDKTEGANTPFWSPDGQFLAYFADDKLKKVAAEGGPSQTLTEARSASARTDGGTWNATGDILYSLGNGSPLMRTSAAGAPGTPFTKLDEAAGELQHTWPQVLPDGKHVLYFAANRDYQKNGIWVQELGSAQRVLVTRNLTRGAWAPPGYLLFVRDSTLYAQRMDARTFQLTGEPKPIAEEVSANEGNGRSAFAVSGNGVLVYRGGAISPDSQLAWYDRKGQRLSSIGKPAAYGSVSLSPDEKSALVIVSASARIDAAIVDLATGVFTPVATNVYPIVGIWSPDSQRILLNSADLKSVREYTVASRKTREIKVEDLIANEWLQDDNVLCTDRDGKRLGVLSLEGGPLRVLSDTPFRKGAFRLAPNGKFVAYSSSESGGSHVMVSSFPSLGEKKQVSVEEGRAVGWRSDGREFFYRTVDQVMSVEVKTEPRIEAGVPKALFRVPRSTLSSLFAPSGDGTRFLVIDRQQRPVSSETVVVVNWAAELKETK